MTTKWTMPTAQELFDNAALGIIGQGFVACMGADPNNTPDAPAFVCLAMSEDGSRRCAIAHSCTDVLPGQAISPQWRLIASGVQLAQSLRGAHDETLVDGGPDQWRTRMAKIALEYRLDDSVLWFVPADPEFMTPYVGAY